MKPVQKFSALSTAVQVLKSKQQAMLNLPVVHLIQSHHLRVEDCPKLKLYNSQLWL